MTGCALSLKNWERSLQLFNVTRRIMGLVLITSSPPLERHLVRKGPEGKKGNPASF